MGIYARHNGEWYNVYEGGKAGGLEGLGGWATIEEIKGKGIKHEYKANDVDWVAYEWTDGGSFTVTDGIIETLTVGSGGYGAGGGGVGTIATGGLVLHTLQQASAGTFLLSVAPAASSVGETPTNGSASTINFDIPMRATGGSNAGSVSTFPPAFDGYEMFITGGSMWCGGNSVSTKTGPGFGGASRPYKASKAGVVVVRVPKTSDNSNLPAGAFDIPTTRQALRETVAEQVKDIRKRRN